MKSSKYFNQILKERGYSREAIEELWKWYDCSEKKGIASY
jgi:predicted Ser/Thr protein kinase